MAGRSLTHRSFVRRTLGRALGLERLDERLPLAGNVSAFVDHGSLTVNGDIGDNELRITQVGKDLVRLETMTSPTTINGQSSVVFKVTKGMTFNMGGGNDVLQFDGISMRSKNDLVVNMGVGDDNLQFNNVNVLRIRAMLGQGHDSATVTNSRVERSLNIFGETGDEQITLLNSRFGEKSVIDGNAGANFINQSNVKFGRKLQSLNLSFGTRPITNPPTPTAIKATADSITIQETAGPTTLTPLTNDTPTTNATINRPVVITVEPTRGSAVENPDGTITYTHDGSGISDEFTYRITDSTGATATAKFTITVNPINDAPIAVDNSVTVGIGGTKIVDVATDDTDEETSVDKTTLAIVTQGNKGTATANADGTITYVANANATAGTDTVLYSIKDTNGNITTVNGKLTVTVVAGTAPVAVTDPAAVNEGAAVTIDALLNDTDADGNSTIDASTLLVVGTPVNGTVTIQNGKFVYTHNGSETTTGSFTYTVRDAQGLLSNQTTVNITVTPVNDLPVAVGDPASVARGGTVNIDVSDNDTDAENQLKLDSIVIVAQPLHGQATPKADGTVDYVNNGDAATSDSFTYKIFDQSTGESNTVTVAINITTGNQAPVAVADSSTVLEGEAGTIDVKTNDSDPDGQISAATVTIVTNGANGNAVVQSNGTIIYTHNGSETTSDSFTYKITDAGGLDSNTVTVTITVTPVNDAPVAVADSASVATGQAVTFSLSANDTDAEGNGTLNLTEIVFITQPANGQLVDNNDGTVTYTHNGNATTSDTFTYTIKDLTGAVSSSANVNITINPPVNQPPVASGDSGNVSEGQAVNINVAGNDTDPENDLDLQSIVIVGQGAHGNAVANGDGTITYTNDGTEFTTDSFTYKISDGDGLESNTVTVNITIAPVNDAPVAANDAATVAEGGSANIDLTANDTDADGTVDDTSIAEVVGPQHGTLTINNDGTVTYTHDGSETTSDSFTYTVMDNSGAVSATATVNITVNPVNDAPVANNEQFSVTEDSGIGGSGSVLTNDTDPEGTALSVSAVDGLANLVGTDVLGDFGTFHINADGTFTYTLDEANTTVNDLDDLEEIIDSIAYSITDGALLASATLSVKIIGHTDVP